MSLYHLGAVYPVLEGLVDYVDNYLMDLPVQRLTPCQNNNRLLRLHPRQYFLKPLQLFVSPYVFAHHRLHQLLALFDALFACEALRSIVVFPVGFMGFPDHRSSLVRQFLGEAMIDGLEKAIDQQLIERVRVVSEYETHLAGQKRKVPSRDDKPSKRPRNASDSDTRSARTSDRTTSEFDEEDDSTSVLPSGHPIIVYPRLDDTWQLAGTTNIASGESVVNVPETHRKEFFDKVCEAVQLMATAGVCHLDIRLSNLFFRVQSSTIANDRGEVQIKIIDFDFAHPQDHVLPTLFSDIITNTINAYPSDIDVANDAWQQYMLSALRNALGLDSTES